jgi:bifunctional DNA-binding transcriptional regulator/antitoxin component of YhaV-PrlF toxin-antitoxin module
MLAKVTSKNQITLPKAVLSQIAPTDYYEVQAEDGRIVLTPVRVQKASEPNISPGDAVRRKLEQLGITEQDIADAVKWARSH